MLCSYRGMVQERNQRSYLVDQAAVSRDCYLSIGTPEADCSTLRLSPRSIPRRPSGLERGGAWRFIEKTRSTFKSAKVMPKKQPDDNTTASAAEIERSILALNKMAERLWGDGRVVEAEALLKALDALNRALDRIRIGESRRVLH